MMTADEDAPYSLSKSRSSSKTLTRKGTISSIKNKLKKFEDGSCAIRRKLVCVGDGCVGKTSFLTRYSTQEFITDYIPTMYNNFKTPLTKYKINEYRFENYITEVEVDDKLVHLALWDTAGQEEYNRLRPLSYPGTDCILLCFAIDNVDSFKNIESKWMPEITHHCPNIAVILVGLKADLRDNFTFSRRCIPPSEGVKLSNTIGAKKYLECSSKTGVDVDLVIESATRMALIPRTRKNKSNSRCLVM